MFNMLLPWCRREEEMDTWQEFWGTHDPGPFADMFASAGEEHNSFFYGLSSAVCSL